MDMLAERARSIVRTQLGLRETDPIAADMRLDALGADDLDHVEILLALEEEFECAIPDAVAERWQTFGDMLAYLAHGETTVPGREAESEIWPVADARPLAPIAFDAAA